MRDLFDSYPYAERFGVNRALPEHGRPRAELLAELRTMADEEDAVWKSGRCSGTMYCGDRDHYAFLTRAFGLFAHHNALQRDMCPSATRFEGEIIAMTLDLLHAGAANGGEPAGMVTSGGTARIAHALLAYREAARVERPNVVEFADRALRDGMYFFMADWSGGKYFSPGMDGSRSDGLLAATWASMVSLGREGYRRHARGIFETSAAMQDAVRSHPELRLLGDPTFLFAFTSEAFDVYHVNDELKRRGWRLNGLQCPNALHMAVTRPQLQPGVVQLWRDDLAAAVAHARAHAGEPAESAAVYGGVPGGLTGDAEQFIRAVMTQLLDAQQAVPSA